MSSCKDGKVFSRNDDDAGADDIHLPRSLTTEGGGDERIRMAEVMNQCSEK